MPLILNAAGLTDRGRVKRNNEDSLYWRTVLSSHEEPVGLFIVADGIGGQAGGEVASYWAIEAMKTALIPLFTPEPSGKTRRLEPLGATRRLPEPEIERQVRAAVLNANEVIHTYARQRPAELENMGSTVTAAFVQGRNVTIANVGDSRTYLIRTGQALRLTQDHSLVGNLAAIGQISPDEVYTHPQRNLILRSLGDKPQVDVDIFQATVGAGDCLLLCSDGLWEMVRDPSLAKIVEKAGSPAEACRKLVRAANDAGGEDNISALVVRVEEGL